MVNIYFGIYPPVRNEQIAVGVTSIQIAEERPQTQPRQDIAIANTSPTKGTDLIYIYFGSQGVATNTAWVLDVGDTIVMSSEKDYPCHQDTISAICATANGKINIIER
jgi:hypothetical protein